MDLRRYIFEIKEFGVVYFLKYRVVGRLKGMRFKQTAVLDYLKAHYTPIISKTTTDSSGESNVDVQPIWVCWWQGVDEMPPIVKACFHSLQHHCNGHSVILITKDNYRSYINFPEYIEKRISDGRITLTHLSDLLRVELLSKYGGLWSDATLLYTDDLPASFGSFFTIKNECVDTSYISDYRWTGYCIGGEVSNPLFSICKSILIDTYWKSHDILINYYLLDYVIALAYTNPVIRGIIDDVEISNPDVHTLHTLFNESYSEETFSRICQNTYIHKLSWKGEYITADDNGNETFFGHLIKDNDTYQGQ